MVFGIPVGLLYGSSLLPMILDVGEDALSIPEVGDEMLQGVLWVLVLMWLAAWLCETVMTSSSWGATLGKWALGVKIVRSDGAPLGFGRAGLRFFAKTLAAPLVPLWIGYLLAVPSARQRTLHDVIAGTAVVRAD